MTLKGSLTAGRPLEPLRARRVLAWRWLPATMLAIVAAACATVQVGSDYDHNASFATYHAFAMMHREHRGVQNPLVVTRAEDAIRSELTRKGYRQVTDPSAADFVVDFTIGARERTDIRSYPGPYAGPWFGGPWWGGPYWGNNLDVRQYREGTLSIDVFDARSHRPVWHGWAKKELSRKDIQQSEEPIRQAVASVLAKFPPA